MARKREIDAREASLWLGVLLDATFDPTSQVIHLDTQADAMNRELPSPSDGGWSAQIGRSELLSIAKDMTDTPDDYPPSRAADVLLRWANRWVTTNDWSRLKARVRKRRQRMDRQAPF